MKYAVGDRPDCADTGDQGEDREGDRCKDMNECGGDGRLAWLRCRSRSPVAGREWVGDGIKQRRVDDGGQEDTQGEKQGGEV